MNNSKPNKKRPRLVKGLTLGFIALFALAMVLSWSFSKSRGATTETRTVQGAAGYLSIPGKVDTLVLKKWTAGKQAVSQMNQLHGKDVSMQDGYIADYADGKRTLVAWVGKAADNATAEQLITRMSTLIKSGNPAYGNFQEIQVEGHPVISVRGSSDRSFYFRTGAWVVWLQTMGPDPMPIVSDSLYKFPDGGSRGGY